MKPGHSFSLAVPQTPGGAYQCPETMLLSSNPEPRNRSGTMNPSVKESVSRSNRRCSAASTCEPLGDVVGEMRASFRGDARESRSRAINCRSSPFHTAFPELRTSNGECEMFFPLPGKPGNFRGRQVPERGGIHRTDGLRDPLPVDRKASNGIRNTAGSPKFWRISPHRGGSTSIP
jgi:hypothetical protein